MPSVEVLRGSLLAVESRLGDRDAAWAAVLAAVARAHGLTPDTGPATDRAAGRDTDPGGLGPLLDPWREPLAVERLAEVHESLVEGRTGTGTFYTPPALVDWVLDRALPRGLGQGPLPHVLDPSCGAGHFLVAAARRMVAAGVDPVEAVAHVHGTDLDPVAVAIARLRLRLLGGPGMGHEPDVRVADGLGDHPAAPFDAVVGNPPFLAQLRRRTVRHTRPGLGPYTDVSAVFLHHSLGLVRDGGTVALVQPLSLLAVRDAAPVRAAVRDAGALTAFWSTSTAVFPGAAVVTCAPVVRVGGRQRRVRTWHGPDFARGPDLLCPPGEWGPLAAPSFGVPAVAPRTQGTVADVAGCTADFRDEYYGLVPHVRDGGDGVPLVTTGLVDAGACDWARRPTRFARRAFAAPTVDLDAVRAEGTLAAWAEARLVPKVLVAAQGRFVEAVVDEHGAWLPSVPVLSLVPHDPRRLWHALAVLLAPPVSAVAAARLLGSGLSAAAVRLSARQVLELPLPADAAAWDAGADLARRLQHGDGGRAALLEALGRTMCAAYGDDSALEWWLGRVRAREEVRATGLLGGAGTGTGTAQPGVHLDATEDEPARNLGVVNRI